MNDKAIELIKQALELMKQEDDHIGLSKIIIAGRVKIHDAVENVISIHDEKIRKEKEKENRDYDYSRRIAALKGDGNRYFSQLLMAQYASNGVNYGSGLQGILDNKRLSSQTGDWSSTASGAIGGSSLGQTLGLGISF